MVLTLAFAKHLRAFLLTLIILIIAETYQRQNQHGHSDDTPINPMGHIHALIEVTQHYGVDAKTILDAAEISESLLERQDLYVSFKPYRQLHRKVMQLISDPTFHLRYGNSIDITGPRKLSYSAYNSSSFEDALHNTIKHIESA